MDRKARRKYIEQVVNDRKIETQEELLKLLTEAVSKQHKQQFQEIFMH